MMMSYGTNAGTGSATLGLSVGIYCDAGFYGPTPSAVMSRVASFQNVICISQNSVTAVSISSFYGTNSAGGSSLGGNISASMTANRGVLLGENVGSLPGGQYWLVVGNTTRTSGANVIGGLSYAHISANGSNSNFGDFGKNNATSVQLFPNHGAFSSSRSATATSVQYEVNMLPATFHTSQLSISNSSHMRTLYVNFRR
jgi:hypothetical protein